MLTKEQKQTQMMRKRNMKLFPIYKRLGWDYLFFYTINFLFLTQVKNISAADVVLIDAFYSLFGIMAQIPAAFIVEFLGRKNSIILANILNCLYMLLVILSTNLWNLAVAEITSAIAFAIKEAAEPALLNESIPKANSKDKIFEKLSGNGASGYYFIKAVSTILAGFLYEINPYIPISLSLATTILVTIISAFFIEPINKKKADFKNISISENFKEIEETFKFILKSKRVKALLLYVSIMAGFICALETYEISLLEDLNVSAGIIGMVFAGLGIVSGFSVKKQEQFHQKYRNKSLSIIGLTITSLCIISGILGILSNDKRYLIIAIILSYIVVYAIKSIYYCLTEKYLRNFTNEKIDAKIYTVRNLFKSVSCAIVGVFASFLLNKINTSLCMIVLGLIFLVRVILVISYMKTRVGLRPEQYSEEERKYDEMKL